MINRIAASLAPIDTEACLTALHRLAPLIGMAEVCLDGMNSFDLSRIIGEAPCPLIITCRRSGEGGHFTGSEVARLDILTEAMNLGCAYVDVEWDSVKTLLKRRRTQTQLIVSHHWMDHMPAELWSYYVSFKDYGDVVKLVGLARHPRDMLPVFDLLSRAVGPVISLAMGEAGQLTRLLAPCFPNCLLTYGADTPTTLTAPGQFTLDEMANLYHLYNVGPHTHICLHLCETLDSVQTVPRKNTAALLGERLYVPLVVLPTQVAEVVAHMQSRFSRLTLTVDHALASALNS